MMPFLKFPSMPDRCIPRLPMVPVLRASMAAILGVLLLLSGASATRAEPASERLILAVDAANKPQEIEIGLMKPFEVLLIAERDVEKPQISTVVFTLDIPEGLLLVGEEILTESLIALGTPRKGINLSFHCVEAASVEVMRFRFLATKALDGAEIRLLADSRTNFRGIVSCKDEDYEKWDTAPSSVHVSTR